MPAYAKFLKEILSSKRKLEETKVVKLNAHCSAILYNKIPKKCGDPDSFTIPCSLGSKKFDKALCDSGASINLTIIGVQEIGRRARSDQICASILATSLSNYDHTRGHNQGHSGKGRQICFPNRLHRSSMEENKEVPLILGRSFLCTGQAILDTYEGQLMLRVGNEKVVFQMKRMIKS
ncbi:uncharacterized protein [Nicotiana tomentosiformis]|uniref:uncharacterized protein n=1 Tax=Nicotiana tomentosiformis TaxID=4098 RepID=UPI00388C6039